MVSAAGRGTRRLATQGVERQGDQHEQPDTAVIEVVVGDESELDPTTGERKWQYAVETKSTSGVLATSGNLVFGGSKSGNFYALDAKTGSELWRLDIGGNIHAAPISYGVDGQQYVTVAAGSALFTFGL